MHVITVYASATFVIIELINNLAEPLNFPSNLLTIVVIVLAIGFPLAIIFSWIFDVTPEGFEKTKPKKELQKGEKSMVPNSWRVATYMSMVIILGLLAFNLFGNRGNTKIDESFEKSIAVLPFLNFSGDSEQDFICKGLTEEVINNLYNIKSFEKIASFRSVMKFEDTDENPSKIANELGVNYILTCSYKKLKNQLRFTVQLIEATGDKQIWQDHIDRPPEEISGIPSDIALQIAEHLKAFLTDPEKLRIQKIPTSNQEAYNKYLLGRFYQRKGRSSNDKYLTAIELLKEAISLDPNFALAYTYLARAYLDRYWFHYDRRSLQLKASLDAIETALRINPELPDAYIIRAQYYYHGFLDYQNALKQLEKASVYVSDHPESIFMKALIYRRMGNWKESIEMFHEAYTSDPGNSEFIHDMSETYIAMGDYQEALTYLNEVLMIDPNNSTGYEIKILTYLRRDGNTSKAKEVFKDAELHGASEKLKYESIYFSPVSFDIYDGNYQEALDFLATNEWEGQINLQHFYPKSLFQAIIYEWMNLSGKAWAYYDSTRVVLEEKLRKYPEDPRVIGALGIVCAGLNESAKAISYGKKAVQLYPKDKDDFGYQIRIEELAWIYVMLEKYDAALDQIELLLSNPGTFSAAFLKLDPKWEPLWDHPEFIRLIEKYAQKPSNNYDS